MVVSDQSCALCSRTTLSAFANFIYSRVHSSVKVADLIVEQLVVLSFSAFGNVIYKSSDTCVRS